MKFVFLDVETTGLDPEKYSVFQIAGIISANGVEEEFDFKVRPYKGESITDDAKKKTGMTDEILQTFPDPSETYKKFKDLLLKYDIGTTYKDKAFFIGYNSDFDMRFMRSFFEYNNDKTFGYTFHWPDLDVCRLIAFQLVAKRSNIKSFKLTDIYEFIFGHTFEDAHDAMADIRATKELFEFCCKNMLVLKKPETPSIPVRNISR